MKLKRDCVASGHRYPEEVGQPVRPQRPRGLKNRLVCLPLEGGDHRGETPQLNRANTSRVHQETAAPREQRALEPGLCAALSII